MSLQAEFNNTVLSISVTSMCMLGVNNHRPETYISHLQHEQWNRVVVKLQLSSNRDDDFEETTAAKVTEGLKKYCAQKIFLASAQSVDILSYRQATSVNDNVTCLSYYA